MAEKIFKLIDRSSERVGLYIREDEHRGLFIMRFLAGLLQCTGSKGTFAIVYREELRAPGYYEFFIIEAFSGVILINLGEYGIHEVNQWKDYCTVTLESILSSGIVKMVPILRNVDIKYYHQQFRVNTKFLVEWKEWWNVKF